MASTSSSSHSTSNVENLPPHLIRLITKQMVQLHKEPPAEGVRVHMNHDDVSDVQATIVGPEQTPYEAGHFRIKLVLPTDYPAQPPRGYFLTKIFHPNVATANGEICVNALKRATDSSTSNSSSSRSGGSQSQGNGNGNGSTPAPAGSLGHVLVVIKCLLINPNPESALNEEAGKLLLEDYQEFAKRAKLMTEIHARAPTAMGSNRAKGSQTKASGSSSSSSCTEDNSSGGGSNKRQLAESNSSSTDLPCSSSSGSNAGGSQSQSVLNKKKKLKRL